MLQLTPRELLIAEFFFGFAPMFRHKENPWESAKDFVLTTPALSKALEALLETIPE